MDYLPGYWYDPRAHNYLTRLANNQVRFVARAEVMRLLEAQVNAKQQLIQELTQAALDGRIAPAVWQAQVGTELKRLYLQNRALGAGGWERLTQADFGHIGGRLAYEYRRLAGFAEAIADGTVTPAQAMNRINMYLGNARREYWLAERDHRQASPGKVIIERRTLGVAEHCDDCIGYNKQGWQLQGVLPAPSERSECGGNCRCSLDAREVEIAELEAWIGTQR